MVIDLGHMLRKDEKMVYFVVQYICMVHFDALSCTENHKLQKRSNFRTIEADF